MDNKGFFKMSKSNGFALIVFIVVSILSFIGPIRNTVIAGLSLCGWLLAALALAVPIYCICVDAAKYNKTKK